MWYMVLAQVISGVDTFLSVLSVILVIYALMTWFVRPDSPIYIFFARIADVVLTPFRPLGRWLMERGLRIDVSVILALAAIQVLRRLLYTALYW